MSLYTVSTGTTINATDVNQLVNVLQQPSGGSESQTIGLVELGAYQTNANVSQWIGSRSLGSVPVSASLSGTSSTSMNAIGTANLNSSGVNIGSGASGGSNTARFGTTVTFQY